MKVRKIKIISVDFQKEFVSKKGKWFNFGKSISFVKKILIPYLIKNKLKVSEIISDYRQPRPGDEGDGCYPGTENYKSDIPLSVKSEDVWIKCMNSPIWIRKNIGKKRKPGLPYQDPKKFAKWLNKNIGKPSEISYVVLIGLTIDYCVFSAAQELSWRGYKVKILEEATDVSGGSINYKKQLVKKSPLLNWAEIISWKELIKDLEKIK